MILKGQPHECTWHYPGEKMAALRLHSMSPQVSCVRRVLVASIRSLSTATAPESKLERAASLAPADPMQHPDYFKLHGLFTVKDLFSARVHWGHKVGSLNPRMKPFVYGSRLGQLIIDLDRSAFHLRQALNFTAHVAYAGGIIMFICRNPMVVDAVEQTAKECGEYAHSRIWQRGIFTNSTLQYGAVTRLPDLCVFLGTLNDTMTEHQAVKDAAKMLIPTVGIVDTNCDPNLVTYPVPGNDDTPCAMKLYLRLFKETILRGKAKRREDLGEV